MRFNRKHHSWQGSKAPYVQDCVLKYFGLPRIVLSDARAVDILRFE